MDKFNYQKGKLNKMRFSLIFTVLVMLLSGCNESSDIHVPCEPLPVVEGFMMIKVKKGDFTLKLPSYVDLRRRRGEDQGCKYVSDLFINYFWYEGKLISAGENRFKVPQDKVVKVRIALKGSGYVEEARKNYRNDIEVAERPWRHDGALPHKRFPLEYYPKLFWDDPDNPSEEALKRARLDSVWGIRKTKYRSVFNDRPFSAFCSIPPLDTSDPSSRIGNDFAKYGDSKCRGRVSAAENGKYLSALIDVWASYGGGWDGAMEINQIYDAVIEQLQSFIEE